MKIGVFSGSFDPIHCGHAMAANYLAQYCGLDQVWLMPSPLNPLKCDTPPADMNRRLHMCRLVADKCADVEVSDFEFSLPTPSYTLRTLRALRDAFPQHEFRLVIGSDNWLEFDRWRDPDKILEEFGVIVYPRPGYAVDGPLPSTAVLLEDAPMALMSSSFIRNSIKERKNLNFFLDPDVIDYIYDNKLYSADSVG